MVTIILDKRFGFSHIKGIILGEDEKVDEIAEEASGMGMDKIGEVGDRYPLPPNYVSRIAQHVKKGDGRKSGKINHLSTCCSWSHRLQPKNI